MQRVLAAVDDEESGQELLSEVGSVANGTGAEVVLVALVATADYESERDVITWTGDIEGVGDENSPDNFAEEFPSYLADDHWRRELRDHR